MNALIDWLKYRTEEAPEVQLDPQTGILKLGTLVPGAKVQITYLTDPDHHIVSVHALRKIPRWWLRWCLSWKAR